MDMQDSFTKSHVLGTLHFMPVHSHETLRMRSAVIAPARGRC